MQLSDFRFELPRHLIAQHPPSGRGASRLLALTDPTGPPRDLRFADLPSLLMPGDLLVLNNTRVMRARLFGHKDSGGKVELLIERLLAPDLALAQLRASRSPGIGRTLRIGDSAAARLKVVGRDGDMFRLRALDLGFPELMERDGHIPLPPYIERPDEADDAERYQTIFAARDGAVAAPTAGLHFTPGLVERLDALGVNRAEITLHVGAGTFQPVRVEDLDQHRMHAEWLEVDAAACAAINDTRARGARVIAVGTTCVRALESAAAGLAEGAPLAPFQGESRLFIRPGYRFRTLDAMITNFHLPESTLLMLVCAFAGFDRVLGAYRHAVEQSYRFFSYGDAMFLLHNPD